MRNTKLLLLFICLFNFVYGQNTKLSGHITHPSTDSVKLFYFSERQQIDLASSKLEDGKFEMSFDLDSAILASFYDGNENAEVILNPGDDLNITLNTKLFDETIVFSGKGATVNNKLNKIYLIKEQGDIAIGEAMSEDDISEEVVLELVEENHEILTDIILEYSKSTPSLSLKYGGYEEISNKVLERTKGMVSQRIQFLEAVKELVGKEVINIKGTDLEGEEITLDKYKGQTIVLDFWATWCGPCKAEMPDLQKLEEEYGENIAFVSVGVFCEEEPWKEMAQGFELKRNIYVPREEMEQIKDYMVNFIPRYMVVDKDFKIVDADAPRPSSGDLVKYF